MFGLYIYMSAYNITNPIEAQPITKILTNYGVKKNKSPITNPSNIQNPFDEEKTVAEIYSALDKKEYNLLFKILNRLPNFEEITGLLIKFMEELKEHDYTMSQLLAISKLLYRLSNIRFVSVILPKEFPNYSLAAISNIFKNKQPNQYEFIDSKIKEIVKNMITHYKLEIKNNRNYNSSNAEQLALKLKRILFSFIIDYTKPESSEPLFVKSAFPPGAIRNQISTKENMWSKGVRKLYGKKNE